ncbi:MAG: peptidase metallopeptidase, partial [Cyanobacteria bacterium P01_H01_bin.15]
MATLLFVCLFAWITNAEPSLPPLQVHQLPQTLQTIPQSSDHYFEKIELSPVGHLIWSEFPIRVYVEPIDQDATPGEVTRQTQWDTAVKTAITEWGFYLPMTEIETRESADIIILR